MLIITENFEAGNTIRLRLDGTISRAAIAEIAQACSRHHDSEKQTILLDMAGVVFMSNDAASRLAGLQSEQLKLINCSPFIQTLLSTVADGNLDDSFKS
jgi:anti-anti-sigma regulatory factor